MTRNLNTIVVGVDGSKGSYVAAERAISLAQATGAKVILATIVRQPEGWWGIGGAPPTPEALASAVAQAREEVLDKMEAELDLEGVDYDTVTDVGDPASELVAIAEETGADMIVIGRRGAGLAERVVLGSVADRLAHHSPIPVLIST